MYHLFLLAQLLCEYIKSSDLQSTSHVAIIIITGHLQMLPSVFLKDSFQIALAIEVIEELFTKVPGFHLNPINPCTN